MKKSLFICMIVFSLIISVTLVQDALAQGEQPGQPTDDEVNAIAKQLYCPVCENVPLDVCGTQACAQWRELIREKLSQGWTEEQIKQYFVEQYGDRVLATPPPRGLNWMVYVVPPIALLLGAYMLFRGFKSWQVRGEQAQVAQRVSEENVPEPEDEYIRRLEEELKKHQ